MGEEFTTDVTEAKGVMAEETTKVETKEKPIAKKPTETVEFSQAQIEKIGAKDKAKVETKITEATKESFKDQDVKTFGQTRNVPKAVADIYAGMFGLNPQTITDKTRNYQKTDTEGLTTAKQFLLKNANNDFARLPKTKDGFGKGTFLPRNVINALYTNGKLTGTLKDYIDLIRQKPVKPIYRDAVSQTTRGLLNLHIRNRMFEDLVTTTAERAVGGAKFSKRINTEAEISPKLKNLFIEVSQARDINEALNILGIEPISITNANRFEKQEKFQEAIEKYKLDLNTFLSGSFAGSGAVRSRSSNGDVYYTLSNGKKILGIPVLDENGNIRKNAKGKKMFNQPTLNDIRKKFGEGVTLLAGRGRLYYGASDPAYIKAYQAAEKNTKDNKFKAVKINLPKGLDAKITKEL